MKNFAFTMNIGVIVGQGQAAFIDSGLDESTARKAAQAVEQAGLRAVALINTHAHADHCGGNAFLTKRTGAVVHAPPIEAALIQHTEIEPFYLLGASPFPAIDGKWFHAVPSRVDHVLGQTLSICGLDLEILPTPGHSINQVAVLTPEAAFLGDGLLAPELLERYPIQYCYDVVAHRATLALIANLQKVWYVGAHFPRCGHKEGTDYTFLPVGDGGMAAAAFERGDIVAYAASMSDAAIITRWGIPLRELTPDKYLSYFGNGFVALGSYIKENPEVIKGFGRALVRGTKFGLDKANRQKVLEYCKKGNPQEGEDVALANALLDQTIERMTPKDLSKGWGYQEPANWKLWHDSSLASGFLKAPLPNLEAAYTNAFVNYWNGK